MSTVDPAFWRAAEAIHAVVYFAPGVEDAYAPLGLRGFWRGYFASRAGALGAPGPEVVTALFHGFAPAMVARAVPDVWGLADRDAVLAARRRLAVDTLTPAFAGRDVTPVADAVAGVVAGLDLAGLPLAAAHAALPAGDDPIDRLWHGATVLREAHGDAHLHVLAAAGLSGVGANVLAVATGLAPAERQQQVRGWSDEEWAGARADLVGRGWLHPDGGATSAGRVAREQVEADTHAVAGRAVRDPAAAAAVTPALVALGRAAAAAVLTYPNPTAVAAP